MLLCCNLQPYGFDVGQSERGNVLKGLDLGVQGMRVGGQVNLLHSDISLGKAHTFILDLLQVLSEILFLSFQK